MFDDYEYLGLLFDEDYIRSFSKSDYKKMVKKAVMRVAFNEYLSQLQQSRKLKNLSYEKFEIQYYIKYKNISNKENNSYLVLEQNHTMLKIILRIGLKETSTVDWDVINWKIRNMCLYIANLFHH